jgi:hypothetical protein
MEPKGYTGAGKVAAFLGVAFSAEQAAHCTTLARRAEERIDRFCNRAWLVGEQTDEAHYRPSGAVYLKYPAIESVEAVKGRAGVGADEETLALGTDYEVEDLEAGLIRLFSPLRFDRVRVSYTQADSVPGDVEQAATELVAYWMRPHLQPGTYGVQSYQLPDLQVQFRAYAAEALPASVEALLEPHRFVVHG